MADFKHQQFEIGLEFVRWSFAKCNNFSEGFSEPKKGAQVIQVQGRQPHEFFSIRITSYVYIKRCIPEVKLQVIEELKFHSCHSGLFYISFLIPTYNCTSSSSIDILS